LYRITSFQIFQGKNIKKPKNSEAGNPLPTSPPFRLSGQNPRKKQRQNSRSDKIPLSAGKIKKKMGKNRQLLPSWRSWELPYEPSVPTIQVRFSRTTGAIVTISPCRTSGYAQYAAGRRCGDQAASPRRPTLRGTILRSAAE
jgi:hypothetical protein